MHPQSWPKTNNREMSLWSHPSRVPRKNHHTQRNSSGRPQNHQLFVQNQIPQIKETSPEVHRIHQLLQKLHTETVRKNDRNVRTLESRRQNHHTRRASRQLQSDQREPSGSLWTRPQTTNCRKTIRTHDGRKFSSFWIRTND